VSDTPKPQTDQQPEQRPSGLLSRAFGVVFSPRATYAAIAARPKAFGAIVAVLVLNVGATTAFLSTQIGKNAYIDQALSSIEGFGVTVNDQMMARIESQAQVAPYITGAAQVVLVPLVALVIAALALAIFNALLGGDGTLKQTFAIVVHSYFIVALGVVFSMPLFYARESMASATSLAVFFPMVDEASFLGRLTGALDLIRIWWLVSLSIGLGVLYRRRTGPIAWSLLGAYLAIALLFAAVRSVLSGA
jgi:hypothetical protein